MKIVEQSISVDDLRVMARESFGEFVKAVVDIERGCMCVDAELHADEEAELIEHGSQQKDLWGINLYPDQPAEAWIEFDSMINVRPRQGNRSRGVDDSEIQKKIRTVVGLLTGRV